MSIFLLLSLLFSASPAGETPLAGSSVGAQAPRGVGPVRAKAGRGANVVRAAEAVRAQAAAGADSIRLIDDAGRTVRLEAPARRIVSLVPALTELLFAMGAGDRVVGRTRFDAHPAQVTAVPSVGDGIRPAAELVVARRPDLVLVYAGADNRGVVAELERMGLPVMAVRHDRLSDLERNLVRLGTLTACRDAAARLMEEILAGLEEVASATRRLPRQRVYYDVWADPPITVGAGSFLDSLIRLAGGRNVFGDLPAASPQVSVEAIAVRRPDVILWPVEEEARSHPGTRPGWDAVEAVRRGAVREVDGSLLHRLGPRVTDAAAALARAIHPGATVAGPSKDIGDRASLPGRPQTPLAPGGHRPAEAPCGSP